MDPSQAPTVALTVGPCESCGAPSAARFDAVSALHARVREHPRHAAGRSGCRRCDDRCTAGRCRRSRHPFAAPGARAPQRAWRLHVAGRRNRAERRGRPSAAADEEPLGDDEEYEDEPDDLMAEEAATVLIAPRRRAPPAPEPRSAGLLVDRFGGLVDAGVDVERARGHRRAAAVGPQRPRRRTGRRGRARRPRGRARPVVGAQRPAVADGRREARSRPATFRRPPRRRPRPLRSSRRSRARRCARSHPAPWPVAASIPAVPRASGGNRRRSLLIGAALAGVAAIGTPVMWKLAFASRPTVVSALPIEPADTPAPVAPRAERVHGTPAAAPAARRAARLPGSAAARA